MENEVIDIFTLVTGPYCSFFEKFLHTIQNFFPDNPKRIHIASDGLDEYKDLSIKDKKIINIDIVHIIDLPYPLIPIQKTYMQKNYVTEEMKYVFYFDIDTIFLGKPNKVWDKFSNLIDDSYIIISKHPHYDAHPELVWNLIEMNKDSKAYIPEEYNMHSISSFWGGKKEEVLKMCDYVNSMVKYDLKNNRYLPKFVDENYINKIQWMISKNQITDLKFYNEEHLVLIPNYNFTVNVSNAFLLQKYDLSIKDSKKNVR